MAKGDSTKEFVRICPKCKSVDVVPDLSIQSYAQGSFFNQHKCNKCGYSGTFFPEVAEGEIKKNTKKKK